jgi:hypothetical protein
MNSNIKPNILQMIKNYTVDTWDYIKEGCPPTPKKEYEERIQICNTCPSITESFRCSECGCPMAIKAKRQTAVCPLNKWPKTVIGSGGKKIAITKPNEKREENNNTTSNKA